jgi:ligand-binding sensor domain-containing protein/signal transduction histidine kinase
MSGWRSLLIATLLCQYLPVGFAGTLNPASAAPNHPPQVAEDSSTIRLPMIEGDDIPFLRLSGAEGLSQHRVTQIVQDNQGFMWFGTQYGLNRYDGYQFKVFKNDPGKPDSFCGVLVTVLYKDRSGALWAGCEDRLDRFDPTTETFIHYQLDSDKGTPRLADSVRHIYEDRQGMLWLSTGRGLYRLDPRSGGITRFHHLPDDSWSLSSDEVWSSGEDRQGTFWVATGEGVDSFDRTTGRVTFHVPLHEPHEVSFYEDRSGVFWILCASGNGLAVLDRVQRRLTRYSFAREDLPGLPLTGAIRMLEDRDGNLWIGTLSDGILRLDRQRSTFVQYRNDPRNYDTVPENRITTLFEDREGDVWVGLGATAPVFFETRPLPFKKLPFDSANDANLGETLVNAIYQDHEGSLWIGTTGALDRCDASGRHCTRYAVPGDGIASDVLAMVEDPAGRFWVGTSGQGLCQFDRDSGRCQMFRHRDGDSRSVSDDTISRLLIDHEGTLWVATAGGLNRFDAATHRFTVFHEQSLSSAAKYTSAVEDNGGDLWIGSMGSGVLRFDRAAQELQILRGTRGEPLALSNVRTNAVFIDHAGTLWAGTENGLDRIDPATGHVLRYSESNGMASGAVACILEDASGELWMSTTKGISRFNPKTGGFQNFSMADGLPGPGADLTAYSACYQSTTGEMYFGGFTGAVRFRPQDVSDDSYAPPVALTAFALFGAPVSVGVASPLNRAIGFTRQVMLAHDQNSLSLEFAALSFLSPETNRYRYRLDGLDTRWHEVGSYQRLANYTTLPSGHYRFRVEGATSRGPWSKPADLGIRILPAWWATWWFRTLAAALVLCVLLLAYYSRIRQIRSQFNVRLEERVGERTRIARELHDCLLQGFQGLMFQLQAVRELLPERPRVAAEFLDSALQLGDKAIRDGRDAVQDLRSTSVGEGDLEISLRSLGTEISAGVESQAVPEYHVVVEGNPRDLIPEVRDDVHRIVREAVRNAYRHAKARNVEIEVTFRETDLSIRVRDDGTGVDPEILAQGQRQGHWGLPGMRERAARLGGQLSVWSERNAGTEIELRVSANIAYTQSTKPASRSLRNLLSRIK